MVKHTKAGRKYSIEKLGLGEFVHSFIKKVAEIKKENYDFVIPENYTMFMSLRNPFDRLVSTYYNKVFPWKKHNGKMQLYYKPIKNWVLKAFPHKILTPYQRQWYNATFEEFIAYTLSVEDEHWNSLEIFCEPCRIDYDYILRVETMERDSQVLMSDLYPEEVQLPFTNTKRKRKNNVSSERIQPKTLDIFSQLSQETLQKLMKKYAWDLEFYGYSFNTTFQAECKFSENNCC